MSNKIKVLYTCSGEQYVRYLLISITVFFSILEMFFYPSLSNMAGCLMALIVCFVHCFFCIKEKYWLLYPFPTAVITSIFIYRWLPLGATLMESKPISYCLEIPVVTFLVETIMYLLAVCAYLYFINSSSGISVFQRINLKIGVFDTYHPLTMWALGVIGLYSFVSKMYSGASELGDVGGKFLNGLMYLQYIPLIFIFPDLCKGVSRSRINYILAIVWALILVVLGIASNGRKNMIATFFILLSFAFLHILSMRVKASRIITIPRLVMVFLLLGCAMSFFQSMSRAQLATRSMRNDVHGADLFDATINAFSLADEDSELMLSKGTQKYKTGWSENYLDNAFLNRYCNIRISDESLWHAFRLSNDDQKKMRDCFWDRLIFLLPSPVISFFGVEFNKYLIQGSRGDELYSISTKTPLFPTFRVVSHSGDGLATFGLLYFPLQFFAWVVLFKLYDSFSLRIREYNSEGQCIVNSVYCLMGLSMLFKIFNYTNGNGITGEFSYFIRGHWQNLFLFIIFAKIINYFIMSIFRWNSHH